MKKLLFLDDIRNPELIYGFPEDVQFFLVRGYEDFVKWIKENGLPDVISFDHDLGIPSQLKHRAKGASKKESRRLARIDTKSGMDAAKWLVDYCLDNDLNLCEWRVHSANPAGAENIRGLLAGFDKFRGK